MDGVMVMLANIVLIIVMVGVTIYLLYKEINLGIIMLFNAIMLIIIKRVAFADAVKLGISGLFSERTIKVIFILFFIMMLESVMRKTGMIKALVDNIEELVGGNRFAAVLMPFVIGLLSSTGGARISCPMVDEAVGENADPETKAFVNYWFRHTWLDSFILYPGVILASELMNVSVFSLFLHMFPFIAITFASGVFFGVFNVKKEKVERTQPVLKSLKLFFINILPVISLIVFYIVLTPFFKYALEAATLAVLVLLLLIKRYSLTDIWATAKEAFSVKYVLIISGVMIFNEVLNGSGVLVELQNAIANYGIPRGLVFLVFPIIAGMLTGMAMGFTSMSFPLLVSIGLADNIWLGALAFAAGMIGQMVTPMHICLVVTADYFKVNMNKLIKRVLVAEIPLIIVVVAGLFLLA